MNDKILSEKSSIFLSRHAVHMAQQRGIKHKTVQFVLDPKRMTFFRAFLTEIGASSSLLTFCGAVDAYKQIRNKAVMVSRAEIIFTKFFAIVCLPSFVPSIVTWFKIKITYHKKYIMETKIWNEIDLTYVLVVQIDIYFFKICL